MQIKLDVNFAMRKREEIMLEYEKFRTTIITKLDKLQEQLSAVLDELCPQTDIGQVMLRMINEEDFAKKDSNFESFIQLYNKYQVQELLVNKTQARIEAKFRQVLKKFGGALYISNKIIPRLDKQEYKFDPQLKFQSIELLKDFKIRQTASQNHYCFVCLDPPFENVGVQSVKFKIVNQAGDVGVGVCDLETLKAKNFRPQLNQLGSGVYICFQDRYTVHTTDAAKNWVVQGIGFTTNDVIEVSFQPDEKKIVWTKMSDKKQHTLEIDAIGQKEFRACVVVKTQNCEVQYLKEDE